MINYDEQVIGNTINITYIPASTPTDREVVKNHPCPDLSNDFQLKINKHTVIYISQEKLLKNGLEYYEKKYEKYKDV